jgi:hypothetical protein
MYLASAEVKRDSISFLSEGKLAVSKVDTAVDALEMKASWSGGDPCARQHSQRGAARGQEQHF